MLVHLACYCSSWLFRLLLRIINIMKSSPLSELRVRNYFKNFLIHSLELLESYVRLPISLIGMTHGDIDMKHHSCEVLIVGGGMVGLSLAYQLIQRGITSKITVLEKEFELGVHSSGRNSGVLHAGLYYKPGSLKSKVCVEGANRLRSWVQERGLPLNPCGAGDCPPAT